MTKISQFLILLLALAVFSCEDKALDPVVQLGANPTLISPGGGSAFVLEEANQDAVMTTFEWTAAEFGYQAAINYAVEIDVAGNNFENAITLGSGTALSLNDVTVGKVNSILLASGLPFDLPMKWRYGSVLQLALW